MMHEITVTLPEWLYVAMSVSFAGVLTFVVMSLIAKLLSDSRKEENKKKIRKCKKDVQRALLLLM